MTGATGDDVAGMMRREWRGVVSVGQAHGEWSGPVRWIIDGVTGRLVTPLTTTLDDAESIVVFAPDESERSVQVQVMADSIADWRASEACDRWMAYHGRADGSLWYSLSPVGFRMGAQVFDSEEIDLRNPLAAAEPRLCKLVNADRLKLADLAARRIGDAGTGALCVGVDAGGIDVRATIGVVRIEFERAAGSAEAAEASIRGLIAPS